MTIHRTELFQILSEIFPAYASDPSENGLQIEGQSSISRIGFAVSANLRTIQKAVQQGCQALIVHHGLFWKGQKYSITGIERERIRFLINHDISLFAYHLPLDAHPQLGNNHQLGLKLGLHGQPSLSHDYLYSAVHQFSLEELLKRCQTHIHTNTEFMHQELLNPSQDSWTLAWCTGAGGHLLEQIDCDYFLSGEFSEHHYDLAHEKKTVLIRAGHYATEQFGIQALQTELQHRLAEKQIDCIFLDAWSPW